MATPSAKWGHREKKPAMNQKEPSPKRDYACALTLDFSLQNTRNKCLLFKRRGLWCYDLEAQMDWDRCSPQSLTFQLLDHVHDALYLISRFLLTNRLPTRVGFQPEATAWIESRGQAAFLFDRKLLTIPRHFLHQLPIVTMTYSTLMIAIMV